MATLDISVNTALALTQIQGSQNNLNLVCLTNVFPRQNCGPYNTEYLDAYGTLSEANNYFDNRLRSVAWRRARKEDKKSALHEATQMIDRLNFIGTKTDSNQVHQFPRGPKQIIGISICVDTIRPLDTDVPLDIKYACFEVAIKLIQGYDPDKEADILAVNSQSYSNARTGYDRTFVPDYMRAGIPSFRAWTYLKPYLRNPEEINLVRC